MKFVHVLGYGSLPTRDFYRFLCKYYNHEDHCIITGNVNDPNYDYDQGELKRVRTYSFNTLKEVYSAQNIIIHGFINRKLLIFFFFQPWLLKKSNWIIWGGDIYCHDQPARNLKSIVYEFMRKTIYPKVRYITTLVDSDYEKAVEYYHVSGTHLIVSYPGATADPAFLTAMRSRKQAHGDIVNILLGNSATVTNQHFAALDMISHYKDENIHIYLPLNYGDEGFRDYAQEVTNYAVHIFGEDKVTPFYERIPLDEYSDLLNTMDIGLFNNDRQQAMGNISQLVQYGAKIFMRQDTTMWDHFRLLGCEFEDITKIPEMDFREFSQYDPKIRELNMLSLDKRNSAETKKKMWDQLFDSMDRAPAISSRARK